MGDIDVIRELEREIGRELKEVSFEDIIGYNIVCACSTNIRGDVIGLKLAGLGLERLPVVFRKLENLEALYLSKNKLAEFPIMITNLKRLKVLDICGNEIDSIPPQISQLTDLQDLDFSSNNVQNLFPEICKLKKLQKLNFSSNRFTQFPIHITQMKSLRLLWMHGNKISKLPDEIVDLSNLESLGIGGNDFSQFPLVVFKIKTLKELQYCNNNLTQLQREIGELENLVYLDLSDNKLIKLPAEIARLTKLRQLDLVRNQLDQLPQEILELDMEFVLEEYGTFGKKEILLYNNPLKSPPPEVITQGREAIKAYLDSLQQPQLPLNEVRVILVGDGGAGKTSLVKCMLKNPFDPNEPQTHGININNWDFNEEDKHVKVHLWDFGGQEIMHATHQFFLSKRSVYILVLDGRKDEKVDYWLKNIESFGGDSPVIVVMNKTDEHPGFDLNRKFLQEKYKGIRDFLKVSCKKGNGIKELEQSLKREILKVELLQTTWPKSWFDVKTKLENINRNYISHGEYLQLCRDEGINKETHQDTLLNFLHNLGVFLHFDTLALRDTNVTNSRWVTEAVYKIINSKELAEEKGALKLSSLSSILDRNEYPFDKHNYIIELMKKFELCYSLDNETVLIPDLLGVEQPEYEFDFKNSLKFRFEYDFLPKSIMPKFIVKMHKGIHNSLCWRTGVILKDNRSTALVKADEDDKKIFIWVSGEQKRDYFSAIRHTFKDINNMFEKLTCREMIPLPDSDEIAIEYEELIGYEATGKDEIFIGKLRRSYSVKELLDGIESAEQRRKIRTGSEDVMRENFDKGTERIEASPIKQKNNPWISGSFYLVAIVVIFASVTIASKYVSWIILSIIIIGSILAVGVIGALQLRNDESLSEENFLKLMIETYKRLPLLKQNKNIDKGA